MRRYLLTTLVLLGLPGFVIAAENSAALWTLTHLGQARLSWEAGNLVGVDLGGTRASDSVLGSAGQLPALRRVSLSPAYPTQISDRGLLQLGALKNLEHLSMRGTSVTNRGLAVVERLPSLRFLRLDRRVTGAGLKSVGAAKNLEQLIVFPARVDNDSLAHLKPLACLKTLVLDGSPITNAGLVHLRHLHQLETLSLRETGLADNPAGCRDDATCVTPAGLAHLTAQVDEHLMCLHGPYRLRNLLMPHETELASDTDVDQLIRLLGFSDLNVSRPRPQADLTPKPSESIVPEFTRSVALRRKIESYRSYLALWRSQYAYVEFPAGPLSETPQAEGLYFFRSTKGPGELDSAMDLVPSTVRRISLRGTDVSDEGLNRLIAGGTSGEPSQLEVLNLFGTTGRASIPDETLPGLPEDMGTGGSRKQRGRAYIPARPGRVSLGSGVRLGITDRGLELLLNAVTQKQIPLTKLIVAEGQFSADLLTKFETAGVEVIRLPQDTTCDGNCTPEEAAPATPEPRPLVTQATFFR